MKNKLKSLLEQWMSLNMLGATKRYSSLLLAFVLSTSLVMAQNITVKGTVLDDFGDPLIGASVAQKGVANGTMADMDGKFTIVVPSDAVLVVSFIGFHDQDVKVGGRTTIDIKLREDTKLLGEVVVTALGIKREAKALGYAVSEVKGDDLTRGKDGNAITALSGRMAGVDISTGAGGPSGSTKVLIRGNSKLSGTNEPLYVVDGVPMDNSRQGSADENGGYDLGDGISAINPADIESVTVLKGASAAALYGSRASNGVVLITTKSGKGHDGGLGIDFSTNVNAVQVLSYFDDYQRVYGQGTGGRPPYEASHARTSTQSSWGAKLDPNQEYYIYNGQLKNYGNKNNNVLDFFRTGVTYTNNLSLTGGSEKGNFRASVSDMRNKDIVPQSNMYRTTVMFRGSAKLGDKITVEGRANYTKEGVNNRPALSDSPNNIGNSIIGIAPSFDQKWLADGYKDELGRYNSWNGNQWRLNPYWVINEMSNRSDKDRMMGHMQINYQILPFLSAQAKVGTDWSRFKFKDFFPLFTDGRTAGEMTLATTNIQETNYEGMLFYNQKFMEGDFDVSAMLGGNIMQYRNERISNQGKGQNIPGMESIVNYSTQLLSVHDLRKQVNSAFGSVGLGYKNFLYVDATIRHDISSTLPKGNNTYTYPSVSGSFIFTELAKDWFNQYKLSFGKLRASVAKVGGDTDPYKLENTYGLLPYNIGGIPLGQLSSKIMPNANLIPESMYSYEFGFDVRFFEDRLGIDFNYFNERTNDQIMDMPISVASGFEKAVVNAGVIKSSGIEIAINAIPVKTRNFDWNLNVNISTLSNKIESLYGDMEYYELSAARWSGASVVAKVGERFGSIMGKKFARNEDGQVIFNEQGMPTYENKISVLGNGNHDVNMGISNSFRYRDFTLGILLDMKFGADIYSMSARSSHYEGSSKNTLAGREEWYLSEEARRAANVSEKNWTPTGGYVGKGVVLDREEVITNANGDKQTIQHWRENTTPVDPQSYWRSVADGTPEPFIYDASYIKLREVSFSYTVPQKLLTKTPIRGLSFSAYGRNLWIIHSKLDNIDPESSYNSSNAQGLEYGSIPSRRTFGFGVNVKF